MKALLSLVIVVAIGVIAFYLVNDLQQGKAEANLQQRPPLNFSGTIVQHHPTGLLVRCDQLTGSAWNQGHDASELTGLFLLVGCPIEHTMPDGNGISFFAQPSGVYTFNTPLRGVTSTVTQLQYHPQMPEPAATPLR